MRPDSGAISRGARGVLTFLFWSVAFGVAYTQPELYYSNQNQYFLHGLARAGAGSLDEDWLANTADPTPAFTALVAFTYRHLHESLFYVYYLLLLGAYFHALVGIFDALGGKFLSRPARLGFIAVLVALHSAPLRWASARWLGVDYPWYFQAGVANQYVLGAGLQPSVFGVLLVLSVAAFLRDRLLWAVTCSSLAAVMHSTYLLSAAFLTLAYLYQLGREKRFRLAALAGLWAFMLVLPVVVYNLMTFAPSSPQAFAEAQHLLAHFRIPHHAEVGRWLDVVAVLQIGWVVLGTFLARGTRLFPVLALSFALSLLLTLVQVCTGNDTLALLFPWRPSSVLVPVSTAVVLARGVGAPARRLPPAPGLGTAVGVASGLVLAGVVAGGAAISYLGLGYRTNAQEVDLLNWVRDNRAAGEVYLLPVEIPNLASAKRGAASLNFAPPPRRGEQRQTISVDLQRFRLTTGAPIYVDFKSIPYQDVEVLEWRRRLSWGQELYERRRWDDEVAAELAGLGLTHVVMTADHDVRCARLQQVYEDPYYRVYRVHADPASAGGARR